MATASITSQVTAGPSGPKGSVTDASRDDLEVGDVVEVISTNAGTAYAWSIAFAPEGSTATFSGSPLNQSPGSFTVDVEGPYLIRLQFTDGTGTTEQFVRLRALTDFGQLKLVAAGERYDTIPIPVDTQPDGWADEQNYNLNTLLDLIYGVSPSADSRVLYVDPAGDDTTGLPYLTIQAAIDYAVSQAPSAAQQWVVLVRPGTYTEDLTFSEYVNVFGWPSERETPLVNILNATGASHSISIPGGSTLTLDNLHFSQPAATANPTISQAAGGFVRLVRCKVEGSSSTGEAYSTEGDTHFLYCFFDGISAGVADPAVTVDSTVLFQRCSFAGQSGLRVGVNSASVILQDCVIDVSGSFALNSLGASVTLEYCTVRGLIGGNLAGSGAPGDLLLSVKWSNVQDITWNGLLVGGTAEASVGASVVSGTGLGLNGATLSASVQADTIFYDNSLFPVNYPLSPAPALTAENVQDAIDEVYNYASDVRTLDDAYDGGDPGPTGSGRTIVADAGAVQIVDATVPSDPIPVDNSDGNLEVVGAVRVGAIGKPEIDLDPNRYGNSARIVLGYTAWPNEAPYGGAGTILANATDDGSFLNYNLQLATSPAEGGGKVGKLSVRGGDAFGVFDGASVSLQAGSAVNAGGGDGGNLIVAPGGSSAASEGALLIANPSAATAATLTAAAAFAGPIPGAGGLLRLGTEFGAVEVNFTGGEDLAGSLALLNAADGISASEALGVITITTASVGSNAEIYFLAADAGIDAALGGLAVSGGAVFVPGTWPETVSLSATAANELTIGAGGAIGPMIYNSDTGKLTVPGLIDPTGMIFDEAGQPTTGANKGAIFVSDGSGGLTVNHLYYVDSAGTATDITTGGGGGVTDLQGAYDGGNTITTAGATDIAFTISAAGGGFTVDGDGSVLIGFVSPVDTFSAAATTSVEVSSRDELVIVLGAISALDKVLDLTATNAGAGEASIQLSADDEILLVPGTALAPSNFKKVLLPDDGILAFDPGSDEVGLSYISSFNGLVLGAAAVSYPGSPPLPKPAGTTPDSVYVLTSAIDTSTAGVGSGSGVVSIQTGSAESTLNDAGDSGDILLRTGNSRGNTGGGVSGKVRVVTGESDFSGTGAIELETGQNQATSATITGDISLLTGQQNGTGSRSGNVLLTTGDSGTTDSGDVSVVTGAATGGTRGRFTVDANLALFVTETNAAFLVDGGTGSAVMNFQQNGVGGINFSLLAGNASPEGVVNSNAGSLFTTNGGELYINNSVGSGTDWAQVSTAPSDDHTTSIAVSPGNTVNEYYFAPYDMTLVEVNAYCHSGASSAAGVYTLAVEDIDNSNNLLSAATFDMETTGSLPAATLTAVPVTGTSADLDLLKGTRIRIQLVSDNADLVADGVYIQLLFKAQ